MITLPQAQYLAYQLTKKLPADSVEKFSEVLLDAKVEMNPHQIEAALFAFRSPLSGGAILADEVGLGKTIEAGLLISQRWAENKRKILILCPSSLRKQWANEMNDKFYLPSVILENRLFKQELDRNNRNPFAQNEIVISSYHFAKNKERYISTINWDLVVIDEAHKLRNAYKENNVIGRTLLKALEGRSKVLLTATPLQNSIMEIYGLTSFIAPYTFGNHRSFRRQFSYGGDVNFLELKERLAPLIHRTLRSQVKYLKFTERHLLTFQFKPTEKEQQLYDYITEYLQRDELFALPVSQRHLLTLVMRKLLASSSFAIAKTLKSLINRLEMQLSEQKEIQTRLEEEWDEDFETLDEYLDESDWIDEYNSEPLNEEDLELLKDEIHELKTFHALAESITNNAKGEKLITALKEGFKELKRAQAPSKALIFTESVRTQTYLYNQLNAIPNYKGKVVLFNGMNNDERSTEIYQEWLNKNKNTDKVTGTSKIDKRQAIVDAFKNDAKIMIATEAAAEGINLQFCAMVVNYDLPWNPQRIEQRIGRCHRYGQKNDVVVVNFLNVNNEADRRVQELLDQKFQLFQGVFGASDEILGVIESGVDFEKKIGEIYQNCRTTQEINDAFDALDRELEENEEIKSHYANARQQLFENFDAQVANKLKVTEENTLRYLNKYEKWLWEITKFYLKDSALFTHQEMSFKLHEAPSSKIKPGNYLFLDEAEGYTRYRMRHPLAQHIISDLKNSDIPSGTINFYPLKSEHKLHSLKPYLGKNGQLQLHHYTVSSFETTDYLFVIAKTDDGEVIPQDVMEWLMILPAEFKNSGISNHVSFEKEVVETKSKTLSEIRERDKNNFIEESDKLTKWAEDRERDFEKKLDDLKKRRRELQNESAVADDETELIYIETKTQKIDREIRQLRRKIMDISDEIIEERDNIINDLRVRMQRKETNKIIYTLNFNIHN